MVLPTVGVVLRGRGTAARRALPLLVGKRLKGKQAYCDAHMNELPIPCGPWGPWYQQQQSTYNKWFGFGLVTLIASISTMVSVGAFRLNFSPPEEPSPPTPMTEMCED